MNQQAGEQETKSYTIPEAMQVGLRSHQAGDLNQAEDIYRRVLAADPDNADATHLLGVIAHQMGKLDEALQMISKAIEIEPRMAPAYANRGNVYRDSGDSEEAIRNYR